MNLCDSVHEGGRQALQRRQTGIAREVERHCKGGRQALQGGRQALQERQVGIAREAGVAREIRTAWEVLLRTRRGRRHPLLIISRINRSK